MIALVLATLLVAQAAQEPDRSAQVTVAVPESESRQHLIGDRPFLRLADHAQQDIFSNIRVQVTVDTKGNVTTANALRGQDRERSYPQKRLAEAESLVRALRYTPFERGGHPVAATFQEYVFVLPPEMLPLHHVPVPKIKNLKSVKITLERTECFGSCPSYSVEVHGDGTVVYDGRSSVAFTGHHRGSVSQDNVVKLLSVFKDADYFSLDDKYEASVTDGATYITSIEIGRSRKQLTDYLGVEIGMPLTVKHVEDEIDKLSGSARWVQGNKDTLSALKAEHWDFKSGGAAATLARVASYGDADAVRDLVSAGVPLAAKGESRWSPPLFTAARRGDLVMLNALLGAGAAEDTASLDSALQESASSGNVEAFRLLVRSGADINAPDPGIGYTVLMSAAASGVPAMVREVLNYKPDVNAASHASQAITAASGDQNFPDRRTALMAAVSQNAYDSDPEGVDRVEVVHLLLEAGADPNSGDKHGNTALILCERADLALLLIKAGADVNARNDKGETALRNASSDSVKRVLLEHGATDQDHR